MSWSSDFLGDSGIGSFFDGLPGLNGRQGTRFATGLGFTNPNSAAEQLDMMEKMAQPTAYGWSWNQYNNQLAYEQYVRELNASLEKSSAANLNYNLSLNRLLPRAVREGLEAAGINPLLAVIGNWSTQTGSVASGGASSGHGSPAVPRLGSGGSGASALISKAFDLISPSTKAQVANTRQDTLVKEAGVDDVKSSAILKKAEAALTVAKAETENAVRASYLKDKGMQADYGHGIVGDAARIVSTIKDQLVGAEDSSVNSAVARSDSRLSSTPSPSSAKASSAEFEADHERSRRLENAKRILRKSQDDYERRRRRENASRIYQKRLYKNEENWYD